MTRHPDVLDASPATATGDAQRAAPARRSRFTGPDLGYLGAVLLGAVLCTITAIQQPFNYDELTQIAPYGTGDPGQIVGATRQPPLAPLLEAGVQQLLGEGHLQQRLLPLLSGIGCLVLMALLLRRYGLRYAGAGAVLVMATTPLLLRYSGYNRPYMEPMVLMMLFAWAAQAWLDDGRRRFLATAALAALAMPVVRVPEPLTLLATYVLVALVLGFRGTVARRRAWPLALTAGLAILTTGLWQLKSLRSSSSNFADTSAGGMLARAGRGVHELVTSFVPLLADSFPWWPVSLAVVLGALLVPVCRRRLLSWPAFLPLAAAPVAFALAYHLASQIPFDSLPYRDRFASFFVLPFVLCVAAFLSWVERSAEPAKVVCVAGLVALVVVTQLPRSWTVLTVDAAPDMAAIADVVHEQVPDDAILLYDRPAPATQSRQYFPGKARYLGDEPALFNVRSVARRVSELPARGPVYLLFNGTCAYPGRCIPGKHHAVDFTIPGWHQVYRHDRFTLYAPDSDGPAFSGPRGTANALEEAGRAMGPGIGYLETYAAAAVLRDLGDDTRARHLVAGLEAQLDDDLRDAIDANDGRYHFLDAARGQR